MKKDVARSQATEVSQPMTDVATGPIGLAAIQAQLVEWCKEKQAEAYRERETMQAAIDEAKEGGFKTTSLKAAVRKLNESVQFYDKVLQALEAGYMLFPPIGGVSIEILAIRSEDARHGFERTLTWTDGTPRREQAADVLPAGEG